MSVAPFGAWAPDVASVDSAAAGIAVNVYPQANGYGPVPSPRPITLKLPAGARGGLAVRTANGTWYAFAGTATKLYRFDPLTLGWTDVSGPTAYALPPEDYWSFALYGSTLFATHVGAPIQEIDIETGTAFADIAHPGSDAPPRCRFLAVVGEFLMLGGLLGNENAVQWSGIADPHFWTPGLEDADIQVFPDGGRVTGLAGGEYGLAFQERAIQRLIFAPGTVEVFQRTKVEDDRGAIAPWSVVKAGPRIFFLDRDGFYQWAEGASVSVGVNRVNAWYQRVRDPTYAHTAIAMVDPTGTRVMWAFKSQGGSDPTILDQCILYDWVQDRWARLDLEIRYWLRAETAPVSLDAIGQNVDTGVSPYNFLQGLSLDSALFSGGKPLVGVFGLDDKLALLEGPSLEAQMETADVQIARPGRAYCRGVRVDTDADRWFAKVGTRESLAIGTPVRFRPETAPNFSRFAPCHASGRYHRVHVRIPAGDAWTYAQAVEPDGTAEGMR